MAEAQGILTRKQLLAILAVLIVVVAAWTVWAASVLPSQRADAERVYLNAQSGPGKWWDGNIVVQSAKARPVGVGGLLPPGFTFAVDLTAVVNGKPGHATATASYGGGNTNFEFPPFQP